ncbi:MAG: class I SAM-dependent methyltransferase [Schwartzia succinivorans]|nr:class I SAM-dependent methyltransferase [Schwartzia succinivorans]
MWRDLKRRITAPIGQATFCFEGYLQYVALLTNPFYFVRKNLYFNLKELSGKLRGRVLDFGCGAKPYREFFEHCEEYVGCDIEVSGHSHQSESIDVFYDGKHLPFDDGSFDGVFTSEVFEHIFNLEEIIRELHRCLRDGGLMLVSVPFVWNEHETPYDFGRYTSFGLRDLLKRNGFAVLELRKSTNWVEIVFQMGIEYLRFQLSQVVHSSRVMLLMQILFIFPISLLGVVCNALLPNSDSLYGDTIVLCEKKAGKEDMR